MKTEIRERKELAVELMEKLNIYKPYIFYIVLHLVVKYLIFS